MAETDFKLRLDPDQDADQIRAALMTVCDSDQFANADRLRSFLTYVVEEALAGRAAQILGKTIAQDVYLRDMTTASSQDNLVRVDAGRLRRKLTDYYESDGADDAVRIHMDSGGYAPWFEDRARSAISAVSEVPDGPANTQRRWRIALMLSGVLGAVLVVSWFAIYPGDPVETTSTRNTEMRALASKSTATVQAENYCNAARGFLFPIANLANQKLASDIFREAIKTDPNYYCGYAGRAHSLSTTSLLLPPGEAKTALLSEAADMARKAVDLAPLSGWSQSALAWSNYAQGNSETALEQSAIAVDLAPTDGNVLDFRAVTLLVLGQFQEAYDISHPDRLREKGSHRFAHRNINAVASFHLGKYQEAIDSLNYATENGDPVSELTLVFKAASYQGLGDTRSAQENLNKLQKSWPDFRLNLVLSAFYADPAFAQLVLKNLAAAGWQANE
ncbi:hypothetical protein [uncultured Shimia sp.]|uniref:tetratricopeptide repeat protein n=1 Tax=uncultured Shimia sp. TaxID=573152 RepID=UPI0026303C10|nr:hypothetical protein [uncultured Shimia sp.]